jgi:prepilin peptidase CpaA
MLGFDQLTAATWPAQLAGAAFVGLLAAAAMFDVWSRRIPNVIPLLLAVGFPITVIVVGIPPNWAFHFCGAGLVLAVGVLLFNRELVGGGDVKLLAAATLWYGIDRLPDFLFAVSIAGGLLALAMLVARAARNLIPSLASRGPSGRSLRGIELPYGVAIALGGAIVKPLLGI